MGQRSTNMTTLINRRGGPTGVAVYEAKKATSSKDKPMKLSEPMNEKWDYSL